MLKLRPKYLQNEQTAKMKINKEGLFKRIIIGISILWVIAMFFYAGISVSIDSNKYLVNQNHLKYFYTYTDIVSYGRWLTFTIPSFIACFTLWIFSKKRSKWYLLNKKMVRVSIGWLVVTSIFFVGLLIESYGTSICDLNSCSNLFKLDHEGFWSSIVIPVAFLQIPLLLYWLMAWIIKGRTIFINTKQQGK